MEHFELLRTVAIYRSFLYGSGPQMVYREIFHLSLGQEKESSQSQYLLEEHWIK